MSLNNWAQRIPSGSTLLLSIATAASILSLVLIFDYPELPFDSFVASSSIASIFNGLLTMMLTSSYAGLFILMFLESLSLPIPSELFLPMTGYFIFEAKMSFPFALGISTIAGLGGSLAAYYIALALGRPLIYRIAEKLGTSDEALHRSESWLNGKGSFSVLISRFVPGFRSAISFPAGALRMNVGRFSIMTLIGSFGWSAILMYIGYSAGPLWQSSANVFFNALSQALPYSVVAASSIYIVYYVRRKIPTSILSK